ncbi:hypothetical protein ABI59_19620 [Acidobacteria bacterium Mor1]|nr:hypothetical protein ABI59_19620 [Acidobacteria bacterium Mor1]
MRIYKSRFVLPVASPPLEQGAVAVDGDRIAAVGPADSITEKYPDAQVFDLGDAALLPGLVNAHTHLELSDASPDDLPAGDYMAWVRAMIERPREPEDAAPAAQRAIETMVARGTVAVGDVANASWIAPLLNRSPLHGVLFLELIGFNPASAEQLLDDAARSLDEIDRDEDFAANPRLRVVLTPHGPQSCSAALIKALAGRAVAAAAPLSIHVAESDEETKLLMEGSGPFRDLLEERGVLPDPWAVPKHSPVEHLDRLGALSPRTLAVHCIHLSKQDLSRLQTRGVTVVTCPRSNDRLGVGRAPVAQLLGAGIPVALGTDSTASAPDTDLFAELAYLCSEIGIAPAAGLRMATLNGARALGLTDDLGSIAEGKLAELIVVPLDGAPDPMAVIGSNPETVYRLADAPAEAT